MFANFKIYVLLFAGLFFCDYSKHLYLLLLMICYIRARFCYIISFFKFDIFLRQYNFNHSIFIVLSVAKGYYRTIVIFRLTLSSSHFQSSRMAIAQLLIVSFRLFSVIFHTYELSLPCYFSQLISSVKMFFNCVTCSVTEEHFKNNTRFFLQTKDLAARHTTLFFCQKKTPEKCYFCLNLATLAECVSCFDLETCRKNWTCLLTDPLQQNTRITKH